MSEAGSMKQKFLIATSKGVPGLPGYEEPDGRRETDRQLRDHVSSRISSLREKLEEIKSVADEEGDLDMADDLTRAAERFQAASESFKAAGEVEAGFLEAGKVDGAVLEKVYGNDVAMLEDLELLDRDVMGLKYETIGALTLREVEGTLASIELKISNRRHLLGEAAG